VRDDPDIIDVPGTRQPRRRRRLFWPLAAAAILALLGADTVLSYWLDSQWFASLGYSGVFWKTLGLQSAVFAVFFVGTFAALAGGALALEPDEIGAPGGPLILINNRPVQLPVKPVLRVLVFAGAAVVSLVSAAGMASQWPIFALWWYGRPSAVLLAGGDRTTDPIFGRPLAFHLFTLPAWNLIAGWAFTIALLLFAAAVFFTAVSRTTRAMSGRIGRRGAALPRGVGLAWALLLLTVAAQVWLGRYDRLLDAQTIFTGVGYTDAHIRLTGLAIVAALLVAGALAAAAAALTRRPLRWLVGAAVPAAVVYVATGAIAGYVTSFIVKPNEIVRERPYIEHNIAFTRQA
jgi:uncharacterized membrane protein (UPF0182 family)